MSGAFDDFFTKLELFSGGMIFEYFYVIFQLIFDKLSQSEPKGKQINWNPSFDTIGNKILIA